MSNHTASRTRLVLAISMILAHHAALAQDAPAAADEAAPTDEPVQVAQAMQSTRPPEAGDTTIEEIVVKGKNIPEPMVRTPEVTSFILPEDLVRQGDGDAASALRRVTGLSVVQGKFVYVRGLGERYSAALLNGSSLPSPEPLQRVVPLDLFPSSVLQSVAVQKTYSAKYPGEFGGGLIDMKTVAVPEEGFFSLSIGSGGDSQTTFKQGTTYYGSDTDYFGYDDGTRNMPRALRDAIATGQRVDAGAFTPEQLQTIGRSLVNAPLNLLQSTDSVDPDLSIDVTGGKRFLIGENSLGLVGVLGFDNSWQTRRGKQQEGFVTAGVIEPLTSYDFRSTQNDVVVNALLGAGFEWDESAINWTNLYIHNTTKEARTRVGFDELAGADVRDDYTEWVERELVNSQLAGRHQLGALGVEWRGSWARTTRDAPYEKGIRYRLVDGEYLHNASQEQNYTRFSEVEDEVLSAGLDVSYAFPADGRQDTVLSGGVAWSDNDRSAESREFRFLAIDGALPLNNQRQRVDFLLSNANIGPGYLTLRETTGSEGAAAYDALLETRAAYLQVDAEFVPTVRTSLGVRYEDAEQAVTPRNLFAGGRVPAAAAPLENSYFLPAATVTWNFYEDMQLRVGASKTIGRPQFRELAPQQYVDTDSDRVFIGNPFLQDTEMLNLESRYEWYFEPGEFLTAGLFYKKLDNPIEAVVNEQGATIQQTYINAPEASLYGAEIEVKKYFGLPIDAAWWGDKRLFVNVNYTYTKSEVQASAGDLVFPLSGDGAPRPALDLIRDGTPLQGQSKHLANAQLGIESGDARTQATLLVTHVGERVSARGRPGQPDLIQYPGTIVDLVVRQGVTAFGQDLTFAFEARNLFGEDYEEFQELGGGRVDVNRYKLGTSLSFSVTAKF